jgi:glycosyltransferase involved in cell wall biosynthesis
MPLLNPHPEHFPRAVESIIAQTFRDWELLIVEDPSPRSGEELLRRFSDERIRHLQNPRRTSFAEQLNRGLAEARSPCIARMDADDAARPDRISAQLEYLRRNPEVDVLGSNIAVIDDHDRFLGFRSYPTSHEEIARATRRYNPLAHPTVMFARDVVVRAGGYRGNMYNSDYDLWSRLLLAGRRLANHPDALLEYRVHPEGMKSAKLREMILATHETKRTHWLSEMSIADRLRMEIERLMVVLPPSVVLRLFLRLTLVRRLNASSST